MSDVQQKNLLPIIFDDRFHHRDLIIKIIQYINTILSNDDNLATYVNALNAVIEKGVVKDVQVNGTSVVNDGVADIDLSVTPDWEIIADVTTTENLTELSIDTDTDNNPFNLSKMYVRISTGQTLTGTKDNLKTLLMVNRGELGSRTESSPTVGWTSATANGWFELYYEKICGVVRAEARSGNSAVNTQNLQSSSTAHSDITEINGIKLQQNNENQTLIPSGTSVTIYGIRAVVPEE